ncbi:hypothetical protein Asi03nite_43720 [Actinoplanes siamensis]|uniref:Uncharacterized protein n=1 Tax=Actinoplanes siamensis TaxID=1223317 RepID=A0A919TLV1_9ACTN|nr:hypothetical protein Asi03nite_43720 [Actinoplanes siamensis]
MTDWHISFPVLAMGALPILPSCKILMHVSPKWRVAVSAVLLTLVSAVAGTRRTGAEPMIIANYGTGTAREAADGVR